MASDAPAWRTAAVEFWRGRRVLLTGHTGFKGAWLCLWLRTLGARRHGLCARAGDEPCLWDLTGAGPGLGDRRHPRRRAGPRGSASGRSRGRSSTWPPRHWCASRIGTPWARTRPTCMGTGVLLEACRELENLQCVLVVTSDKVYENHGAGRPFEEGDRLGGHDPYSSSKACAELLTASFRESFFGSRAADRHGARRQRHRRRRLVGRPAHSRLRARARGARAGAAALPGRGAALAARARTAVGLSRARTGAG